MEDTCEKFGSGSKTCSDMTLLSRQATGDDQRSCQIALEVLKALEKTRQQ